MIDACRAAGVRTGAETQTGIVRVANGMSPAEQLERLRDELFTATAHAIKTPVAIIRTAAQVLSRTVPSNFDRSAKIIERQSARIDALLENLLALSRIRSGTLQLHPIDVELAPLLLAVVGSIGAVSDGYDVQVHVEAHPRIRADRERLAMVLRNTFEAATRSSRAGQPVTIRLRACAHDAMVQVFYQTDEGVRSGAPQAPEFDELGVGRCVTETIVALHGGTFTETTGRQGVTIRIQLPALPDEGE